MDITVTLVIHLSPMKQGSEGICWLRGFDRKDFIARTELKSREAAQEASLFVLGMQNDFLQFLYSLQNYGMV